LFFDQVVEEFASAMSSGLDQVLGHTLTDLDGRFATVRTRESNLCNLLSDVFRRACSADVCILNSGTFRWAVHNSKQPLCAVNLYFCAWACMQR
jgi:2',3'-cyclic-nucleotide 2'-phosphodiesterase (5'-nucleotidase family)